MPFGIDDMIGAAITGGISFLSQESTNDTNQDIANQNSAFNAEQAALTRDFNADQARINREWSASQAADTRAFNSAEASEQRAWQERMSKSAYQNTVWDLKQAGLNPMLAYMKGGNMASGGATASAGNPTSSAASAGGSAQAVPFQRANSTMIGLQAQQLALSNAAQYAQIDATQALADRTRAEASNTRQETYINSYRASLAADFTRQQLANMRETEQQIIAQTGATSAQAGLYAAQTEATIAQTQVSEETARKIRQEVINAVKQGRLIDANTGNTEADTALIKIRSKLADLELPMARNRAGYAESFMGTMSPAFKDLTSLVNSASEAKRAFAPQRTTEWGSNSDGHSWSRSTYRR